MKFKRLIIVAIIIVCLTVGCSTSTKKNSIPDATTEFVEIEATNCVFQSDEVAEQTRSREDEMESEETEKKVEVIISSIDENHTSNSTNESQEKVAIEEKEYSKSETMPDIFEESVYTGNGPNDTPDQEM